MATKNIVPRGNNEGQLGTDEKRWNSVIAETASFTTFSGSITGNEFTLFSGSAQSTASFGFCSPTLKRPESYLTQLQQPLIFTHPLTGVDLRCLLNPFAFLSSTPLTASPSKIPSTNLKLML